MLLKASPQKFHRGSRAAVHSKLTSAVCPITADKLPYPSLSHLSFLTVLRLITVKLYSVG